MSFIEIAEPLSRLNVPTTPVRPGTKRAFLPDFPTTATTDIDQLYVWNNDYPDHNAAAVARAEEGGVFFFEVDSPDVLTRIKNETGHDLVAEVKTYRVRSSPGKGHFYLKHNAASMSLGNISQTHVKGRDWSLRTNREYVIAAGSVHPVTLQRYVALDPNAKIIEAPEWLLQWFVSQKTKDTTPKEAAPTAPVTKIKHGAIHGWILEQAGRLRWSGLEPDEIETALLRLTHEHCEAPIDNSRVVAMARSMKNYPAGTPWQEIVRLTQHEGKNATPLPDELEETIPAFDPDVMGDGILRDYVELVCDRTSMAPQFPFLAARVIIGALMAPRVRFQDADTDALLLGAAIGATGTSKGWAWTRVLTAFKAGAKALGMLNAPGFKVIDGIDSGAGLKDYFFTAPEDQPVVAYVSEVADLGEKSDPRRNPGILTTIIELAENRSVSRTLANRKRHKDGAYFGMYICGQSGDIYMSSLPGKKSLGLFDRFRPEYSEGGIAGDTPDVDVNKARDLMMRLQRLLTEVNVMTLDVAAKAEIDNFWSTQSNGVQTKVRYKKHLVVDSFMLAFSRGSKIVEVQDAQRAIKIFQRELIIRDRHFGDEMPDRGGLYLSKMKALTERMARQLNNNVHPDLAALGRSDYEKASGAYKLNDDMLFDRVFQVHVRSRLQSWKVRKGNGQEYIKYIPQQNDDGSYGWGGEKQ